MIVVIKVRFCDRYDDIFRDESGDVVNVTVGVVTRNAAIEPQDLIDAQIVMKDLLKISAAQAWVPLLYFAQETLFGCEQYAGAIRVDGAALKHNAVLLEVGRPLGQMKQPRNALWDFIVQAPIVILCPGVKLPIRNRDFAGCIANKDWA
jgi:hypothetical protein